MIVKDLIIYAVLLLLSVAFIFLWLRIGKLRKRINELFDKKEAGDIEAILNKYVKGVKKYFNDIEELKDFSQKLFEIGERSIQKIGIIRFNPFGDVGGDQSFSIALLNLDNSGVIITSLYSRDGTRVYSKAVKKGESSHHLAEEETQALEKAIKDYKKGD